MQCAGGCPAPCPVPSLPHHVPHAAPLRRSGRQRSNPAAGGTTRRVHMHSIPDEASSSGRDMAAEFAAHVLQTGAASPAQRRKPSHLMPPTEVVAAQLDALQRNDWPEPDAGVQAAFVFSKPAEAESLLPGQHNRVSDGRAAAWGGSERWLRFKDFSHQLHSPPFSVLLSCDAWEAASPVAFPAQREGQRALQAVTVMARRRSGDPQGAEGLRPYTFTFCLERVAAGPYKDCWMTVGLRCGDYATV